jgi:pilus assembly protein CpaE
LPILVLTARAQAADQEAAMAAGANDFLAKPFNADELNAKLLYIIKHRGQSAAAPAPPKVSTTGVGRVLAVTGWRGGVGRTTIAINLAGSLARSGRRVCLVELSPAGGQALLHLRVRATTTWLDVLPGTDKQALAHLLATHESGLMLLTAPLKPTRKTLARDLFQNILNVLGTMFTDVVIDTAPLLDDATALALASARHAVLVLTPEVGALHATRQALETLADLGVSEGRQKIILNHISPEPGLPPVAVEKALGRAPDLNIPFDRAQTVALAQGAPLVFSQPTAALVTALAPFAVKL